MDKLINVKGMMERYGCSRQTAIRYMQKMEHMENPYAVKLTVLEAWERDRTVKPPEVVRAEMARAKIARRLA